MKLILEIDDQIVKDILQCLPEYSLSMRCTKWDYENNLYDFIDVDEDTHEKALYTLTLEKSKNGFQKVIEAIQNKKLFLDGFGGLADFLDPGCWDGYAVDCLIQMGIFGEVRYG